MNELRSNQTTLPMQTASRSRCLEMKGKPAFMIREGSAQVVVYKSAKRNQFCLCYRKHAGAVRSRETRTGEKAARARALEIAIALANGRAQVLELGAADRDGYLYAKSLLPASVPLHVAIEEWVAARGLLGPTVGLLEVVRDWKRRHLAEHCEYFEYSSVPAPRIKANNRGEGLPSAAGIYFVWEGLRCVYVGRSRNLSLRCILGKHPALKPGDALSWLEEPVVRLRVAEAFYIGTLRPERNFRMAPLGLIIPSNE
jgi:hypothetical protein